MKTHPTLPYSVKIEGNEPRAFQKVVVNFVTSLSGAISKFGVESELSKYPSYRQGTVHFSTFGKFEIHLDNGVIIS